MSETDFSSNHPLLGGAYQTNEMTLELQQATREVPQKIPDGFKIGVVVRLASGGPRMTVTGLRHTTSETGTLPFQNCTWFDENGVLVSCMFPVEALRLSAAA